MLVPGLRGGREGRGVGVSACMHACDLGKDVAAVRYVMQVIQVVAQVQMQNGKLPLLSI